MDKQTFLLGQPSLIKIDIDPGSELPVVTWYRLRNDSDDKLELT